MTRVYTELEICPVVDEDTSNRVSQAPAQPETCLVQWAFLLADFFVISIFAFDPFPLLEKIMCDNKMLFSGDKLNFIRKGVKAFSKLQILKGVIFHVFSIFFKQWSVGTGNATEKHLLGLELRHFKVANF